MPPRVRMLRLPLPLLVAAAWLTPLALGAAQPAAAQSKDPVRQLQRHRPAAARPAGRRCARPRITRDPANATVIAPAGVSLHAAAATARNCSPLKVIWQVSNPGGRKFTNVRGATSRTLVFLRTNVSMSGRRYHAVFTNAAGATASRAAVLAVRPSEAVNQGQTPTSGPPPTVVAVNGTATGSAGTPLPTPGQQSQLFAPASVWNQPLAANAPVDPTSAARVASLLSVIDPPGAGVWVNWDQYSIPVYRVSADQPTVRVTLDTSDSSLQQAWEAVPMPAAVTAAPGADGAVVVYQPSSDRMWEFWQLSQQSDGFHARWGGAMSNVATNPGFYSPVAWPGLASWDGWNWGSSASSLPAIAGLMTISELQSGHIDHALSVAIPQPCAWFVWPAQRTDGASSNPDCLPEGAHLRLDPSLDLSTLGLPPIALMMATAIQKYGIIVHDTSSGSVTFFAEQPTDGSDPYDGPNGIFDGLQEWQFLPMIPWNRLQLLQMGPHCVQAPCAGPAG